MVFPIRPLALGLAALVVGTLVFERARAGGDHYYPPVADPLTRQECGSCHMAFPPALLPSASWRRMMADLSDHFGDDASLDAATNERITRYLVANAGDSGGGRYAGKMLRGVSAGDAPLRITELPKWVREHREVARREWSSKEVGSKANCPACHVDADRGYFEDD